MSDPELLFAAGSFVLGLPGKREFEAAPAAIESLRYHGLLAALHTETSGAARDALPPPLRAAARAEHLRVLGANLHIVNQAAWLLGELRQLDLSFAVLKGPVLAYDAWGQLGTRTFGDIDVLTEPDGERVLCDFLRTNGFEEAEMGLSYERVFLHAKRNLKVEPHIRVVSRSFLPRLETTQLGAPVVRSLPQLGDVPTLSLESHLLVLGIHAAKHLMEFFGPESPVIRLMLYLELVRYVDRHPELDWDKFLADCSRFRCRRAVLHGFACARRWFGWQPPAPLRQALDDTPDLERLVASVTTGLTVSQAQLKRSPMQLARQFGTVVRLRDSRPEGWGLAARYFVPPLFRRLVGRA